MGTIKSVFWRCCLVSLLIGASPGACSGGGDHPHPPTTAEERLLADRYRQFARALEQRDAAGICRQLTSRLARSYRCSSPSRLRVPSELRDVGVSKEIFAVTSSQDPGEVQISAPRTRGGRSLIVFFRRQGNREWRIERAAIGGYG